MVKHCR